MTVQFDTSLPSGWCWAQAFEVCLKIQDGTHFSPPNHEAGDFRYITAKNVRPTGIDLADATFLSRKDHEEIYRRCDPVRGDVLLVKDGVNAGDAAINTLDEPFSLLSSVCFLRPDRDLLSGEFLRYFFLSPSGAGQLRGGMTGTAIKRIVLTRIRELPIPVAPLAEQARIVSELAVHLPRIEAALDCLLRARTKLDRYRASVLKAACEGRLVPTEAALARAEGCSHEPAQDLLARILTARRARWEANNSKRAKKYTEPAPPDAAALPELPESWVWGTMRQFSSLITKGTTPTSTGFGFAESGIRFVKVESLANGRIDHGLCAYISDEVDDALKRSRLEPGDLLISIAGTLGRSALVVDSDVPANTNQAIAIVRPVDEALGRFAQVWVDSIGVSGQIDRLRRGIGMSNLNLEQIADLTIPLPPLAEQRRIVADVERRLSIADVISAALDTSLARATRLRQSILKRAFEGKLVPQDPNDEPASALLERIRKQRQAAGSTAPTGKPKSHELTAARTRKARPK